MHPDIGQIGIVVGFRPNNKNLEEKNYVGYGNGQHYCGFS